MIFRESIILKSLMASLLLFSFSCASLKHSYEPSEKYKSITGTIPIPAPTSEQIKTFNKNVKAEFKTIKKADGKEYSGYVTDNQRFFENVMKPALTPHIEALSKESPGVVINKLTLFTYEIYRMYFGDVGHTWEFYRWGGDLYDLDDPQDEGVRHKFKYGLDCSGFVSTPYTLAEYFGLINSDDEAAVFCSKGFEKFCYKTNMKDRGARDGWGNNFRVDSCDISRIGRPVFTIEKNAKPKKEDLEKLQPGDLVSGPGHVGIVVEANGKLCYLESGINVIGRGGEKMPGIEEALEIFAKQLPVTIRRSLPDRNK